MIWNIIANLGGQVPKGRETAVGLQYYLYGQLMADGFEGWRFTAEA
jgi:hypothetical protein